MTGRPPPATNERRPAPLRLNRVTIRSYWLCVWMLLSAFPAHAQQANHCAPPMGYLLLDRSGSMADHIRAATGAANRVAQEYADDLHLGLWSFPNQVRDCAIDYLPDVLAERGNRRGLENELRRSQDRVGGQTPLAQIIGTAAFNLYHSDTAERKFIILATDGVESCGGDPVEMAALVARDLGIKVHVIGILTNREASAKLDSIARAGQTARAHPIDDISQLSRRIDAILQEERREICDGLDNDCDGQVDETPSDNLIGRACRSHLSGQCNAGRNLCRNGQITCEPSVTPRAEQCNGLDDDCDGQTDENIAVHACNSREPGVCRLGTAECRGGRFICRPNRRPSREVCDGRDNDCDGHSDENYVTQACHTGQAGECNAGRSICSHGQEVCQRILEPSREKCDGIDNDCDGRADEKIRQYDCQTGELGVCSAGLTGCESGQNVCHRTRAPSVELCDSRDNDCDGATDEGDPESGRECDSGALGVCQAGTMTCTAGQLICVSTRAPTDEICDLADNDCDGQHDETDPHLGQTCSTGKHGVCDKGQTVCDTGELACTAVLPASKEVCDAKDNDCDGLIDEQAAGRDERCSTGQPGVCSVGKTVCQDGEISCLFSGETAEERCDGVDNDCDGFIDESTRNGCGECGDDRTEVCNGLDEDCDQIVDENAACPPEQSCVAGGCAVSCEANECRGEFVCSNGYCLPACKVNPCASGMRCTNSGCIRPCEGVTCDADQVCHDGHCLRDHCARLGCPQGKTCVDGECADDPCYGVTCDADYFCRDGSCVATCAHTSCPFGESCLDGECFPDACAGVQCELGQFCADGDCENDPCAEQKCPVGEICVRGRCMANACLNVTCPKGQVCHLYEAIPQCLFGSQGAAHAPLTPTIYRPASRSTSIGPQNTVDASVTRRPGNHEPSMADGTGETAAQRVDDGCSVGVSDPTPSSGLLCLIGLFYFAVRRRHDVV
ncbi:MAG: vWA domain-containing protein [Myxococcota bacterium]|nr:vWA domain-containing protein [Myxococcota bacterium]